MHLPDLVSGSLAGLAATVPMTAVMVPLHRQLPPGTRGELPPREVTVRSAERAGAQPAVDSEGGRETATWVSHFAYGAAMGAGYALVAGRLPGAAWVRGVGWGVAVWAGSYLGWLPLAGIRRSAARQPPAREAVMVAAHVVYGAVTGLAYDRLRS